MPIPTAAQATIDLNPGAYQASLGSFRQLLETSDAKVPFLRVAVKTPGGGRVELQIRQSNAYLVGFHGADSWYSFDGEKGGWGPSCGTGSNYSELGTVGTVTYDDLRKIGDLAKFKKGESALDKRIIAILIAVVAEAARFATVATYFTGLVNSVGTEHGPALMHALDINFEVLKKAYFNQWDKPPRTEPAPGEVLHFTKGEILVAHKKGA